MRKARNKAVSLIVTLTFLLGLVFAYAGPAVAGDPLKFTSAFPVIEAKSDQPAGWFKIDAGDYNITGAAGWVTYITIDLSSGAKWHTKPQSDADVQSLITNITPNTGNTITFVASDDDSLQFTVSNATYAITSLTFDVPNLDITSGTTGDVTATVKVQSLDNSTPVNEVFTHTATVKVARIGEGKLTATADSPKKISGAGLGVKVANISVEENQAGVLKAGATPDTITLTIKTDGVTWGNSVPAATGTAGLAATGMRTNDKTLTYTITNPSSGIGGKLTFVLNPSDPTPGYLNISPGVSGDIVITVASSNTALADTDLTVATTTTAQFTVTPKDTADRKGVPGQVNVTVGDLEIKQNFSGAFTSNGSLVFTLKNAKWNDGSWNSSSAPGGFTKGTRYNDGRSIWYSVTGTPATTVTFDLPTVDLDANASGDIVVVVSGTAGPSGEYVVGKVVPAAVVEAAKVNVAINSLDQAAGDIKITEADKNRLYDAGNLVLTLPNGIYFSKNPKVYLNGEEVTFTWSTQPKGTNRAEIPAGTFTGKLSSTKADVIEIRNIAYDVDSRFATKDIAVELSGTLLTGSGGSTKTVLTVANAVGTAPTPPTKREASFVIGSTTYKVNGKDYTMDVAPYIDPASGRTFVPVRYVAYALGVSEDNIFYSSGVVSLLKDGRAVQMTIGSKALVVNGVTITMDAAPVIKDGRTMLPYRWIATALGATVKWDEATKTVTVNVE